MVNDSMKSDKLIGMIQPKNSKDENGIPKLHNVGCLGKIDKQIKSSQIDDESAITEFIFSATSDG